jgi:hypothetical protein
MCGQCNTLSCSLNIVAMEKQQCVPFILLRYFAVNYIKYLSFAMEKQQLFPSALLTSYKIFRTAVNSINFLRSSRKVPDIFLRF